MNNVQQVKTYSQRKISDFLFILWAGGAALLSYSLVYALRKPYTAAGFDGIKTRKPDEVYSDLHNSG